MGWGGIECCRADLGRWGRVWCEFWRIGRVQFGRRQKDEGKAQEEEVIPVNFLWVSPLRRRLASSPSVHADGFPAHWRCHCPLLAGYRAVPCPRTMRLPRVEAIQPAHLLGPGAPSYLLLPASCFLLPTYYSCVAQSTHLLGSGPCELRHDSGSGAYLLILLTCSYL